MKILQNSLIILVITCLAFFSSCTDEIEISDASITQSLVLNSIINPDSIVSIELSETKTIPGVSTSYYPIKGATVILFENNVEKEILNYTKNTSDGDSAAIYESNSFYPEADKTYRVEVSNTDFDDIDCETTIPTPIAIESLDTICEDNSSNMTFEVTFTDSANVNNYYRILIRKTRGYLSTEWNGDTHTYDSVIVVTSSLDGTYLDSEDPVFVGTENADDYLLDTESDDNEFNIFSDELFDGQSYTLDFSYYARYLKPSYLETDKGEFYKFTILLQSISYEEYKYLRTYANFEWNEGGNLSEPVQVYSNIDNGTGIFAGFSTDSASLMNGEYPMDGITYVTDDE